MTRILLLAPIAGSLVAPPVTAHVATGKKHRHYYRQGAAAVVYQDSGNWQARATSAARPALGDAQRMLQ